jgi:amino acid transporter
VSFQVGWLYYLARLTAFAANVTVLAAYAAALYAPFGSIAGRAAVILAVTVFVTWINVVGVRRAIRALDIATLLKVVPLIALIGWALAKHSPPAPQSLPELGDLESVALITLYAFIGFENNTVPAEETRNPERTIPRALIATIAGTVLLYFLIQLAYVSVMPGDIRPNAPLADMGGRLFGPAGVVVLSLTAILSVFANSLGNITSTPRVAFALGEERLLPAWFARVHPKWLTPANSVIFYGIAGAALALSGSFLWLAVVSTLARLIVYAASLLALPSASRAKGRRLGLGMIAAMGGGLLVCAWAVSQSTSESWLALAALVAVGAIFALVAMLSKPAISRN